MERRVKKDPTVAFLRCCIIEGFLTVGCLHRIGRQGGLPPGKARISRVYVWFLAPPAYYLVATVLNTERKSQSFLTHLSLSLSLQTLIVSPPPPPSFVSVSFLSCFSVSPWLLPPLLDLVSPPQPLLSLLLNSLALHHHHLLLLPGSQLLWRYTHLRPSLYFFRSFILFLLFLRIFPVTTSWFYVCMHFLPFIVNRCFFPFMVPLHSLLMLWDIACACLPSLLS